MPFMDMPYMPQGLLRSAVQGQAGADPARTQQPTFRDVSNRPQQPATAGGLADLLKGLIGAGIDPSRLGLQGMFGQQQQQQPTFRDVSNRPQQPTIRSRRPQPQDTGQPTLGSPTPRSVTQPTFASVSHRPKPMSPYYEPPVPWRSPSGGP